MVKSRRLEEHLDVSVVNVNVCACPNNIQLQTWGWRWSCAKWRWQTEALESFYRQAATVPVHASGFCLSFCWRLKTAWWERPENWVAKTAGQSFGSGVERCDSSTKVVDTHSSCALREYSVPLERISESQLVLCHPERRLLPLVLSHCHHTLRKGGETDSRYDLPAIQMQLVRRFLAGKPLIQEVNSSKRSLCVIGQEFRFLIMEFKSIFATNPSIWCPQNGAKSIYIYI